MNSIYFEVEDLKQLSKKTCMRGSGIQSNTYRLGIQQEKRRSAFTVAGIASKEIVRTLGEAVIEFKTSFSSIRGLSNKRDKCNQSGE